MVIRIFSDNIKDIEKDTYEMINEVIKTLFKYDTKENKTEEKQTYKYNCNKTLQDEFPKLKIKKVLPTEDIENRQTTFFGEENVKPDKDFDTNLFDLYRKALNEETEESREETKANVIYMDFSEALKLVKSGKKIARKGWNDRSMFVRFVRPIRPTSMATFNPYFTIKNVDDSISVWVPSTGDLLAMDWYIVE